MRTSFLTLWRNTKRTILAFSANLLDECNTQLLQGVRGVGMLAEVSFVETTGQVEVLSVWVLRGQWLDEIFFPPLFLVGCWGPCWFIHLLRVTEWNRAEIRQFEGISTPLEFRVVVFFQMFLCWTRYKQSHWHISQGCIGFIFNWSQGPTPVRFMADLIL